MEEVQHHHQLHGIMAALCFLSPATNQWWDHEDHLTDTTRAMGCPGRRTSGLVVLGEILSDGKAEAQPSAHLNSNEWFEGCLRSHKAPLHVVISFAS